MVDLQQLMPVDDFSCMESLLFVSSRPVKNLSRIERKWMKGNWLIKVPGSFLLCCNFTS